MGTRVEADREFWSRVLTDGGTTTVPRWVRDPAAGTAEHEAAVPDDVAETVRGLVGRLGVPVSALLLAAHAKVLAALSGEPEVVTGYAAGVRGEPLPCRLAVPPGSWRSLVSIARHAEADVLAHREFPVDELRRELGAGQSPYEIVFGPRGPEDAPADEGVLDVRWSDRDGRLRLRLRHRTDVLDAAGAARIAGYHLTALRLLTADVDAEHAGQSLLSADEVREQLEGLAGPGRSLPDARAHEL
ncbi:non-ribosomal peptide synthetase, partial [Streptomyces sp. NPDC020362]